MVFVVTLIFKHAVAQGINSTTNSNCVVVAPVSAVGTFARAGPVRHHLYKSSVRRRSSIAKPKAKNKGSASKGARAARSKSQACTAITTHCRKSPRARITIQQRGQRAYLTRMQGHWPIGACTAIGERYQLLCGTALAGSNDGHGLRLNPPPVVPRLILSEWAAPPPHRRSPIVASATDGVTSDRTDQPKNSTDDEQNPAQHDGDGYQPRRHCDGQR